GSIDPALKPCIHPQLDHAAEPIPVALEQVCQRLPVARAQPLDERVGIGWVVRHGPSSYPLTSAPGRWRDKAGVISTGPAARSASAPSGGSGGAVAWATG